MNRLYNIKPFFMSCSFTFYYCLTTRLEDQTRKSISQKKIWLTFINVLCAPMPNSHFNPREIIPKIIQGDGISLNYQNEV